MHDASLLSFPGHPFTSPHLLNHTPSTHLGQSQSRIPASLSQQWTRILLIIHNSAFGWVPIYSLCLLS